jgi:rfaE bifunctional protein nucleotidyltransferase chain/domain
MTHSKILSVLELQKTLSSSKGEKKVVHCHGVFDLLHPGHIRHLQEAKAEGDILVVTVTPDRYVNKGPGRPVFTEFLRAEHLAALQIVDYVAINEWPTAVEAIRLLKPQVYVKGGEYQDMEGDITGKIREEDAAVQENGGRVHFTHDITFSSSKLLQTHFDVLTPEAREYMADFKRRHSSKEIISLLQSLKDMKVLVIGDAIIDEYHFCQVLGAASKSASMNARFLRAEEYAGGSLAVANHVAAFAGQTDLITCLGAKNDRRSFIESHLRSGITSTFIVRPDGPTTIKRRFLAPFRYQRMFEVTFVEDSPLPKEVEKDLQEKIEKTIGQYDLVISADFGHGMLSRDTIELLSRKAKYLAVNVQTNSTNQGYNRVTKYPRADYLCIDQEEMRLGYHDRFGSMESLIKKAQKDFSCDVLTVTQGSNGSLTAPKDGTIIRTPVFSSDVVDSVGAGDAYLAVTSPCAAAHFPPDVIGFIGTAVGGMAIKILGNKESIEAVPLFKYIDTLLK